VATTRHHSRSLLLLAIVLVLILIVMNYIVVELVFFSCSKLYYGFDYVCDIGVMCDICAV
jgi:hypothetical protein